MRIHNLILLLLLTVFKIDGYSQITYPIKQVTKSAISKTLKSTSKQNVKTTISKGAKVLTISSIKGESIKLMLPTNKTLSVGAKKLCEEFSGKFPNADFRKVITDINHYKKNVLVEERNFLTNRLNSKKDLTAQQKNRLEELNYMLPKEGYDLSDDAVKKIIKDLSSQSITTKIPDYWTYDRWIHVTLRHTSPQFRKSYFSFTDCDDLIKNIDDVIKTGKTRQTDKCTYYLKTFDNPIGYDKNHSTPLYDWLVICKNDGSIITSYPINKNHAIYKAINSY